MVNLKFKLQAKSKNFSGYRFSIILHINRSTDSKKRSRSKTSEKAITRKTDFSKTIAPDEKNIQLTRKGELSKEGLFEIVPPEQRTPYNLKELFLVIYAPNGQELHSETIYPDNIREYYKAGKPYTIELTNDWSPVILEQTNNPFSGRNINLNGWIVVQSGKKLTGSHQVILLGNSNTDEQFYPVFVSHTSESGYFFGPYPRGNYKEVYGVVGSNPEEKVPVRLENGRLPRQVLLMVDLDDDQLAGEQAVIPRTPDAEDLLNDPETFSKDPSKGNCFDFTAPDRVLQEHSFYSVVRTTDPDVRPYDNVTIGDTNSDDLPFDINNMDPKIIKMIQSWYRSGNMTAKVQTNELTEYDKEKIHEAAESIEEAKKTEEKDTGYMEIIYPGWEIIHPELQAIDPGTIKQEINNNHPIDWDEKTGTFYQATTVSHGHILHYKTKWQADGYSLGNLLYSLPLAPCQKKQIAIVDWERRDTASTKDSIFARDRIDAGLDHNRDIDEIVQLTLSEGIDAGSTSKTTSGGGGGGFNFVIPGVFSIGGGGSGATSRTETNAFQAGERNIGARSAQALRDRITQSANSIRNQRSTVITAVNQGETSTVTTEVVANHNHCHAMTVEYFEVLRHLKIVTDLADVQECLFIPLLITSFDDTKILKHQQILKRNLKDKTLKKAFEAIERNKNGSDLPEKKYADEYIENISGHMFVNLKLFESEEAIKAERDKHKDEYDRLIQLEINSPTKPASTNYYNSHLKKFEEQREAYFQEKIAPSIARELIGGLKITLETPKTIVNGDHVPLDPTLSMSYKHGRPLGVDIGLSDPIDRIKRSVIRGIRIEFKGSVEDTLAAHGLSPHSRIIAGTGQISYTTRHLDGELVRRSSFGGDLAEGSIYLDTLRLTEKELKNPREEDKEIAKKLKKHLNANLEYYHRLIWLGMDANKRYRLLDRFRAPNSSRSLASVVENKVIGIAGNSLIMPVARGFRLDPNFDYEQLQKKESVDENGSESELNALLNYYAPITPIPADHIALPTKGVFAEAKLGSCNSCEEIDDSRFWKWHEAPCGDEPTPILPASTDSRNDPNRQPPQSQGFSTPIINMQQAPAAPDPTGLQNALQVLNNPNLFKDLTGLEGTQANTIGGLNASLKSANAFAETAAKVAMMQNAGKDIDRLSRSLNKAVTDGAISPDDAKKWMNQAYNNWTGGDPTKEKESLSSDPGVQKLIDTAAQSDRSKVSIQRDGESVDVSIEGKEDKESTEPKNVNKLYNVSLIPQPSENSCWAASMSMLVSYKRQISVTPEMVVEEAGKDLNLADAYSWDTLNTVKDHYGFEEIELASNASLYPSPEDWHQWLNTHGPLWVTVKGAPSHALIVRGIEGDLTANNTTLHMLNPAPVNEGREYDKKFPDFAADFGNVGLDDYGNWRILYLPGTNNIEKDTENPEAPPPGQVEKFDMPELGEFHLKLGDRDWITGEAGKEKEGDIKKTPIYEGNPLPQLAGSNSDEYVRNLQKCLKELGFWVVGEPNGIFEKNTEHALKEFQIYAKMEYVAQEFRGIEDFPSESNLHDRYLYTLRSIKNQKRLASDFPVSGELNAPGTYRYDTIEVLQFWKDNDYKCPVVIEAYKDEDIEGYIRKNVWDSLNRNDFPSGLNTELKLVDDEHLNYLRKPIAPPVQEKIWEYNSGPDPSHRYFAFDFTKHYNYGIHHGYRYNYNNPIGIDEDEKPDVAVLGFFQEKKGVSRGGPSTKGGLHTWYTAKVTENSIFGFSSPSLEEQAFFKIFQSLSELECSGYWDGTNGWDSGLISLAPYHHVLTIKGSSAKSWKLTGEATGLLGKFRSDYSNSFSHFIDFFGVSAKVPSKTTNGIYGDSNGDRKLLFHTPVEGIYTSDILEESYPNTEKAKFNFLKSWHWFYRWLMLMRTNDDIKKVMYNAAEIRLKWLWGYLTNNRLPKKHQTMGIVALFQRTHMAASSREWINEMLKLPAKGKSTSDYKKAIIDKYVELIDKRRKGNGGGKGLTDENKKRIRNSLNKLYKGFLINGKDPEFPENIFSDDEGIQ